MGAQQLPVSVVEINKTPLVASSPEKQQPSQFLPSSLVPSSSLAASPSTSTSPSSSPYPSPSTEKAGLGLLGSSPSHHRPAVSVIPIPPPTPLSPTKSTTLTHTHSHQSSTSTVVVKGIMAPFANMSHPMRTNIVFGIGEFVGTFLFLFFAFAATQVANTAPGNGRLPSPSTLLYISLAFGFSLMVNVWAFFRVTGGAFNPAVSFPLSPFLSF